MSVVKSQHLVKIDIEECIAIQNKSIITLLRQKWQRRQDGTCRTTRITIILQADVHTKVIVNIAELFNNICLMIHKNQYVADSVLLKRQ